MEAVKVRPYYKASPKGMKLCFYRPAPFGCLETPSSMAELVREGHDLEFDLEKIENDKTNGKTQRHRKACQQFNPATDTYLRILESLERSHGAAVNQDPELITRIIKEGGLSNYIKKLEGMRA